MANKYELVKTIKYLNDFADKYDENSDNPAWVEFHSAILADRAKQSRKIVDYLEELYKHEDNTSIWYLDPDGMDWNLPAWKCEKCGCRNSNLPSNIKYPMHWSGSKYCPNCGARIVGYRNERGGEIISYDGK